MPFEIGGKGDAFHVTYKYVLNNDVRYLYSGYPLRYKGREDPDYPNFDMLRLARESSNLKRKTLKISRYSDQDPFMLPRAPAFRDYSKHSVNHIVERLYKPNSRQSSMSSLGKITEDRRCVSQLREPLKKDMFPSYRSLSPEQVKSVSNRLYHTHTHMSNLKKRDPDEVRQTLPIMKNSPDPDRIKRPMHPMHTHPWDVSGLPAVDI